PECTDGFTAGFFQEIVLEDLPAGEHNLELKITDRGGHSASIKQTFRLCKITEMYNGWYWNNTPSAGKPSLAADTASATSPVFHLVVVSTGNEEASLATIDSIGEQIRKNWKMVLVGKISSDLTSRLSESLPASKLVIQPDLQTAIQYLQSIEEDWS